MSEVKDVIIGIHSIAEAINNPKRLGFEIVATNDGLQVLKKFKEVDKTKLAQIPTTLLKNNDFQKTAQRLYQENDWAYSRIPSNILLKADALEQRGLAWLYNEIENKDDVKMLALDGVTDIHNLAAIVRTSSFFGIDAVLVGAKSKNSLPPSTFRIASGALEYIPLIYCPHLSRVLTKLQEKDVFCLGLAEEVDTIEKEDWPKSRCLVLGAEDHGLSHAVRRVVKNQAALPSFGKIKSLNVSVAAALSLEKFIR